MIFLPFCPISIGMFVGICDEAKISRNRLITLQLGMMVPYKLVNLL